MVNFSSSFIILNLLIRLLGHTGGEVMIRQSEVDVSRFWRGQALNAPRCSYRRINCYQRALESDPAFHQAYLELAEVYYELGITYGHRDIFADAAINFQKALELDNSDPEVHRRLGQVYFLMRDFKKARQEMEIAREMEAGRKNP